MTESAYFSSLAKKDCYNELDVEEFEVVGTFDKLMCDWCGDMDGKVFPMSKFEPGTTAPPFHPWCRCTTVPYFEDMENVGERFARDTENGKVFYVPSDMTFEEWKANFVDKSSENGIMKKKSDRKNEEFQLLYVGKIDRKIYKCVTDDIVTDEVIITDTQIQHIKERHPNDYERYFGYVKEIIEKPDYILAANKPNTAVILKHIIDNGKNYQLILRLKTSNDPKEYKNSVITFLKVEDKRYNRYLRTKKILYKSE